MSGPIARVAHCAAFLGLTLLSGCSWLPWSHQKAAACPLAVVLQPLRNTAVFAAGKPPRPANVAFYGILDQVKSRCSYADGTLRVKLKVYIIAQRGPAATSDAVDFDYFVAILGPGQSIIGKTPLRVHIVLPPKKVRAGVTDEIEEAIPLNGRAGKQLAIDLGFQQSPQVVEYYRHYRGR